MSTWEAERPGTRMLGPFSGGAGLVRNGASQKAKGRGVRIPLCPRSSAQPWPRPAPPDPHAFPSTAGRGPGLLWEEVEEVARLGPGAAVGMWRGM